MTAEQLAEFNQAKNDLLYVALTEEARLGYGVSLSVVEELSEKGETILFSSQGEWHGHVEGMGLYDIPTDENSLDFLLLIVGQVYGIDLPITRNYDHPQGVQAAEAEYQAGVAWYLEQHSGVILDRLIGDMNKVLVHFQAQAA